MLRGVFCAGLALLAVASTSNATVVFNSRGFENPPYTLGTIHGQQGWVVHPSGTALGVVIQNATVHDGGQALQVAEVASGDAGRRIARTATGLFDGTGTELGQFSLEADLFIDGDLEALFQIVGRDDNNRQALIVSFQPQSGNRISVGSVTSPTNAFAQDTWFSVRVNAMADHTVDVFVNDLQVIDNASWAFPTTGTGKKFHRIDFDIPSPNGDGRGVFVDNFVVTHIPEPSSLLLVLLGAAGLFAYARRRS